MKQVKLIDNVHEMLNKIVEQRKKKGELGVNKQVVVNQLIMAAYKKECK
jgi:hypothetical protein